MTQYTRWQDFQRSPTSARTSQLEELRGKVHQFVRRMPHRRDNYDHLVAGLLRRHHLLSSLVDFLSSRDRCAAKFLNDDSHTLFFPIQRSPVV